MLFSSALQFSIARAKDETEDAMAKKGDRLVRAKDVVKDPSLADELPGQHILLHDKSASTTFENQLTALDLLVARGWQVVSMSTNLATSASSVEMYILLRRGPDAPASKEPWPY
jgi:hypothetical protein